MDSIIAGAISGFVTRAIVSPLDVIKIRFQLQWEPISSGNTGAAVRSKYRGLWHCIGVMLREEGVAAFWKGHVPAQMLSIGYGAVQFWSYEMLQKHFHVLHSSGQVVRDVVCGTMAGALATVAVYPLDTLRTRFGSQGQQPVYRNLTQAVQTMVRNEGPASLYKGLFAGIVQIAPAAGIQFAMYHELLFSISSFAGPTMPIHRIVCGAVAGVVAKAVTLPFDTIKKRLQIIGFKDGRVGFGRHRDYQGSWHCFVTIVAEEGVRGLYKGALPTILKSMLSSMLTFMVYDEVMLALKTS